MLSIATKINAEYYEALAREDYYELGGEPPGRWKGRGAEALGLEGEVKPGELSKAVSGFDPHTGDALVRNAGHEKRNGGLDLTFSAPKSVSAIWSVSEPERRREIQQAQSEAVDAGLSYLESEAGFSRVGRGGREYQNAKLIFGVYDHCTCELMGIHAALVADRFEAITTLQQATRKAFGSVEKSVAEGLKLRHDNGSQFVSRAFQAELRFLGMESSPSFVRAPEGNGCIERFWRTLKEQLLWIQTFASVDELNQALRTFQEHYNRNWLIGRHGHRSPAVVRQDLLGRTQAA